jgi:long-chain acyl-CoA synthetase
MFYQNFRQGMTGTACDKLILARIPDYLPPLKKLFFWLGKGRKIAKVPPDPGVIWWSAMMHRNYPPVAAAPADPDEMAVILYSGGTTGVPKGIMLSHRNFISEGMMVASWSGLSPEEHAKGKVLAALPIFHGFGLGVCVNSVFMGGGTSILVPTFTPESVARLIKKKKPTFVIGVPTLYEALCRNPQFRKTDLSCLKGTFSGADTLSRALKEEFESVCRQAGGSIKLLEGYGLTEAVTAVMAMPLNEYREGSVGIPFPDMLAKIVEPGTTKEAATGQEGEICLHGPAVMLGYLDQPEETANVLQKHADGQIWLHTGDLATMDEDGFVYFKQRLKRMIKSSGMNVYPGQVEEILRQHAEVAQACVIGVPDLKQGERVKGFVVLRNPDRAGPEMERELIAHSARYLIKWSCPREIEFRPDLPKTLVGKIAFHVLEQEARAKEQE